MKTRILAVLVSIFFGAVVCHAGNKPKPEGKPAGKSDAAIPKKEKTSSKKEAAPATSEEAALAAKKEAKKAAKSDATADTIPSGYPLKTCVVSGEPLKFGTLYTFTYHRDNKPDCTVVLCCKNCVKDFEKTPDKYIDKVFAAKK